MYLTKKSYVKNWEFMSDEQKHSVTVTKNGEPTNIKPERVSYVEEEIMYWRKANQIHGWFTENTTEITPDVRYRVSKTDLEVLLETCKKVIEVLNNSPKKVKQVVGGWKDGQEYMVDVDVYDNDVV